MTTPLFNDIYQGYAYSYPHKHSYRKLNPLAVQSVWEEEKKDALFLYVHLPFCEMRCGFCNLFTIANPKQNMVDAYLDALATEADSIKNNILPGQFARMAIGGGTPTFLELPQLERLFSIIRQLGAKPENIPVSFETSPATINREKLVFLFSQGVNRISMGVQSFVESEVKSLGRPQKNQQVYEAIELLQQFAFETINIDLIYGAYGQTLSSWLQSVQATIRLGITEVYIYPLYVRPLTGINKSAPTTDDNRFTLYLEAKQMLLAAGYKQVSMRMFTKNTGTAAAANAYSCQEDGMLGIGAGARSYTRSIHYSSEYAVARQNIKSIIEKYIGRPPEEFGYVDYGIVLGRDEQQRRFIIKSILHGSGLDMERYRTIYGKDAVQQYPQLQQLVNHGLASVDGGIIKLTSMGFDYSDAIGPALYSANIKQLINEFELK